MSRRGVRRRTFLAGLTFCLGIGAFLTRIGPAKAMKPDDVVLYKGWIIKPSDLDL